MKADEDCMRDRKLLQINFQTGEEESNHDVNVGTVAGFYCLETTYVNISSLTTCRDQLLIGT